MEVKNQMLVDGILSRRSIRKYTGETIPQEDIEKILRCAMQAPSARNKQPWHFMVLTDKAIFEKILEFQPHTKMLASAACAVLVLGDEELSHTPAYWPVDCAAATQNLILAAHGMGYGAVWLGMYPRPERLEAMSKLLNLPPNIHSFALVSIGVPAQELAPTDRYNAERVHWGKW